MMNSTAVEAGGMDDVTVETEMTEVQSPVERAEAGDAAGASLPHPDEIRASVNPRGNGNKFCSRKGSATLMVFTLAMILVIVLSVIIGVTVSNREEESSYRASSQSHVQDYVTDLGISTRDQFIDDKSPQFLATQWLAVYDEMNLKVPEIGTNPDTDDEAYQFVLRYVMVVLYYATGGENWKYQFNFLSAKSTCAWNGVLLSSQGGFISFGLVCNQQKRAFAVYLDAMDLTGELPFELAALDTVTALDFNFNEELSGDLTRAICSMPDLESLSVGYNKISGNIPGCINALQNLRLLFLPNTQMRGPLPNMDRMVSLERVFLDDNRFEGDITTTFDNMPELKFLFLEDNAFTGSIDSSFLASNEKLIQVDISDNRLDGEIPVHLMEFGGFQLLDLHGNALVGPMPDEFPEAPNMLFLALHDNDIEGTINPSITNLTMLFHLDLSNNTIEGDIIPELGTMRNLTYLYLGQNDFNAGQLPDSFADLTKMEEFSVKSTDRAGDLPDFIGTWKELVLLDLDDNDFGGNIPSSWGDLSNLEFLLLNDNLLIGEVPDTFEKLVKLRAAFLEGNGLEGDLAHMCKLAAFNELEGDLDGTEVLVADCDGGDITCSCCVCCDPDDPNDGNKKCNDHELITNLNPQWEFIYTRVRYDFGNETRFVDRAYLP